MTDHLHQSKFSTWIRKQGGGILKERCTPIRKTSQCWSIPVSYTGWSIYSDSEDAVSEIEILYKKV
ncbi:MAG: hypothetical protein CMG75_00020 [Candidatus Marinimicrobia bacterium]|nr:hypothetical protein [Candidatus Neomarinimicrobiota bacterium]